MAQSTKKTDRKGSYHLLMIPEDTSQIHRVRMRRWHLHSSAAIVVGLVLGLVVTAGGYLRYQRLYKKSSDIRGKYADMQKQQARLAQQLMQLKAAVQRAEGLVDKVDGLVAPEKVSQHLNRESGVGPIEGRRSESLIDQKKFDSLNRLGPEAFAKEFDGTAQNLMDRSLTIEKKVSSLYQEFQDRMIRLSSTPEIWPVLGWTTSRFGVRRSPFTGKVKFHEGIDVAAPWGSSVKASGAGIITFAGYRGGLGKTVVIDHGFGMQTVYGHNSKLFVSAGDKVDGGMEISAVGNTGHSTGPHLHFEVHVDGVPVDPMNYLPARSDDTMLSRTKKKTSNARGGSK